MASSDRRRDASRRQLQSQLRDREQRAAARRRFTLITSIAATVAVVAIVAIVVAVTTGGKKSTADNPTVASPTGVTASTGATTRPTPGTCSFPAGGSAARTVKPPATSVPTTGSVTVDINSSQGPITMTLNPAAAPCTVASFVSLAQQKYFDGTSCHRLVTSGIFVLQCGDPTGTGSGGPGYTIPDEATGAEAYPAGTVAMARTQSPESGGSQFFIVYQDSPNLQQGLGAQQYTVFGKVTAGLDVVQKVGAAGASTGTDGAPKLPVELKTVRIG